ncbi:RNA polymerase sigma factor RpoD/SigA [Flagellimonas taeanensis]|jgi:RNA polymerase primary sigma factor|uniref:RNA polymerase primary sigma factor n=1 Tax=Flagellimonas taeanensis TaxID=1005926 RepID=A0A1M6YE95_9FLAO|nr:MULTISPECIES: RNA polymerase sigma factor RpoD/SigA [Allomuricauda]MDC6383937.1 RNA polymerase sigma factor RpoD/SigA [Muricauda sp. SK9]MEE1961950.1 RNA polymerase sigma factor RpoD/SigA [Allomuricauda taeanensis]RIV48551.1 RNA polymerase sigma factor RpoD/SigA [Allomuricauda taeanensis]SFC08040.1 RNA polymerase primary sigma factor [Allomuricauda taeanensis]SHL16607.1 RNA polymerase primary sigma factor [Allomuricauda taeanensis]
MRPLSISKQITKREAPSLTMYLNDISRIPMITENEEVDLAVRIRQGDTKALERLVSANLRFVVSVAKQYQSRGLNLHDLINEGNVGLVRAASKFDETRGFKFISYAVWWIRQGIIQALAEKSRMVRLPLNKINVINKINKATSQFEQNNERVPTAEEITELIDFSLSEIQICLNLSSWAISMDEPLNAGDGDLNMYDTMSSQEFGRPEEKLIKDSLQLEIDGILEILSYREAFVIKMYFGIGTDDSMGMEEIAFHLDLTTERVRQIKTRALNRLRNSSKIDFLKEYLE